MCYGTTSSSESALIVHRFQDLMTFFKLRFKEGNRICRTEEPGYYMLHERLAAVSLLHQPLPKGIGSSLLLALNFF